jgi:hypothetical protein
MSDQAIEQSVEERMMKFVDTPEIDTPEVEEEAKASPEPEEETEVVEEEASEEEPEAPRILKLTHNGEEIEKPEEEVIALAQQGFDYTQKTQKLAEERKAIDMRTQALKAQEESIKQQAETSQAYIKEIARITSIDEQIAQFDALDWNALSDNDPVQAQKLYIQYQQLQNNRTRTLTELQQKQQQLNQQQELQMQTRLEQARADLLSAFPNWNEDIAKEVRESGKSYGFSEQELSSIIDPRHVKVLHDAAMYRKLQAQKGSVTKKVIDKPAVVKPGTKDKKSSSDSEDIKLRQDFKKSRDPNLAAKLIERML